MSATPRVEVLGLIGNGPSGAADVDWYSFTLVAPTRVNLTIVGQDGGPRPVLGLYVSNPDPYDFSDPFAVGGTRLLQQTADDAAVGGFERDLAAGTYAVAISGAGNHFFNPFLADSGYDGETGAYSLVVDATALAKSVGDGPAVLVTDPAAHASLASSPMVVRIDLDAPLDPGTLNPGSNIRLIYNASGAFGDGSDQDIYLTSVNYSAGLMELQLTPAAPLQRGSYKIYLQGDASFGDFVLTNPSGTPLGADAQHPLGQDFASTFQIAGIESQTNPQGGADDTAPFACDLGELPSDSLVQITGAIGDDPYYDPNGPNGYVNPSSDVDMYRFHISGSGSFAFAVEVFAGRIGSPLDPGVSLYRMDPTTHQLIFVGGNHNTGNTTATAAGSPVLVSDPALFVGLTEGEYYVAVSTNFNTPTTSLGFEPGTDGIFDPKIAHSGTAGFSTGPYVLNLIVHPDGEAPTVVAVNPAGGDIVNGPPGMLVVQFSEMMNLQPLFFQAFEQGSQQTVAAVFVQDADGVKYYPRLISFDQGTNIATFMMMDGLVNGAYTLHLAGSLGLTDMAGQPLVGNDPAGDYVVAFTVAGELRGIDGNPLERSAEEPNDSSAEPQDLGILFPKELQAGVVVTRDFSARAAGSPADNEDTFKFQVLQLQQYVLDLSGIDLPIGMTITVTDLAGTLISSFLFSSQSNQSLIISLDTGTYLVRLAGWTAEEAGRLVYRLRFAIVSNFDNAPALTLGPAPALQLRFVERELQVFSRPPPPMSSPSPNG
ncbi:MAG: T9SS type A sorting domain-containing protein, partial [Planctomycetota bacterium]